MRLTGEQPGFSLIELLVAVFVIVLLTGVVSLNVGRGGAERAPGRWRGWASQGRLARKCLLYAAM